jgi:hypothetical protein
MFKASAVNSARFTDLPRRTYTHNEIKQMITKMVVNGIGASTIRGRAGVAASSMPRTCLIYISRAPLTFEREDRRSGVSLKRILLDQ